MELLTPYVRVNIGDMRIVIGKGTLITFALGSCIGVSFYDPILKIGALLHIMLPEGVADKNPYLFADVGIKKTLETLYSMGVDRQRLECKIAGGASMLSQGCNSRLGKRNGIKVKEILHGLEVAILGEDIGGYHPRTMVLNVDSGLVTIRSFSRKEVTL